MIKKIGSKFPGAFKNKKGFTLVEVIVVLVILAILAAILVPKLIGWIDQSKEKTAIGEAHLVLSALQADGTEQYANQTSTADGIYENLKYDKDAKARVQKYLAGDIDGRKIIIARYFNNSQDPVNGKYVGGVMEFQYRASNKILVEYNFDAKTGKGTFKTSK
ncbi:MAG: prepilin-type N-terminal cleavage/methylation domain-containing protein [Clostridiales bacterium]